MENSNKVAVQALHFDINFDEMILIQLKQFIESTNCCITYSKFYDEVFRQKIMSFVEKCSNNLSINLKYRVHEYNGLKYLKVYKSNCTSFLYEDAVLNITEESRKLICKYLYENVLSLREQVDLCPGFLKPDIISKPRIQIYHFTMTKQNNTISVPPKCKSFCFHTPESKHISIYRYKDKILKNIEKNQVVIITHDIGIDKLAIAQFILENSSMNNEHCRIIYSNNQKFVAVKNSETIARRRGEIIGLTTGYQIPLKSVSSCNKTNLLFTSSAYFLRCLMGVNSKEAFYGISHVILDDVHERDFRIDLLLFEIREVLSFYPNLRVLLLCLNPFNTKSFEDYFKKVESLNLKLDLQIDKNVQVHYLNKILKMINYKTPEMETYINLFYGNKVVTLNDRESQLVLNNLLDRYINDCDLEAYDKFCYLVQIEHIPVDIQHSDHLMNMLMGAAKNNKIEHLKALLKMNANIYLSDFENRTAQDWAKNSNSTQCMYEIQKVLDSRIYDEKFPEQVQRLKAYRFTKNINFEIDHKLIFELVKFLHHTLQIGNILIIVPDYDDMLKVQYHLENFFDNNQIKNYKIFKLHKNIKMTEIDEILDVSMYLNSRKIIFSTEIVESFCILHEVLYVIDSGLIKLLHHTTGTHRIQWISKDRAERRKDITSISDTKTIERMCFRLYTSQDLSSFPLVIIPELMHIPLDNVCLFVKILSPYTTIKDYFMRTICTPSNGQIEKSIQLLKSIGAFEEQEIISILGMRLIDIPLHVQLGKVLIYAIFMQCLDPVLTIISILQCNDHLFLPDLKNSGQVLYLCKEHLAEGENSDHLTFLRIFQKWQDDRIEFCFHPMSEGQFLLDQNLQVVCEIRSEIVGIVRSAQLIHANGLLSMNYINSCANNWATVKACFVAGMYPNICHIERDHSRSDLCETQFKCNSTECIRKLFLYPGSVLRSLAPDSWNKKSSTYQTDWLFYQNCVHREKVCRIQNASLITPITIAMFAGKFKKSEGDIINEKFSHKKNIHNEESKTIKCNYSIDDWMSFSISEGDAYLIFNLRQKISHIFLDLLQNCDNHERLQRYRRHYVDKLKILEIISKVLQNEDINSNFHNLDRIGERPKALPLSYFYDKNTFSENENNASVLNNEKDISNATACGSSTSNQFKNETTRNKQSNNTTSLQFSDYNNNHSFKNYLAKPTKYKTNNSAINLLESNNLIDNKLNYTCSHNTPMNHQIVQSSLLPIECKNKTNITTSTLKMNFLLENVASEGNKCITDHKLRHILNDATPYTLTFYILPCWNRNDATEYMIQNKFNKNCFPLWNEICLKFIENVNIINYVFLFDIEEACFCFSGFLIWNGRIDGIRLQEIFKVNFTIDHIIAKFKDENRPFSNFIHYIRFGEIHFELGYDLMRCMEMFEKMSEPGQI